MHQSGDLSLVLKWRSFSTESLNYSNSTIRHLRVNTLEWCASMLHRLVDFFAAAG
jgi:hypothetical protein